MLRIYIREDKLVFKALSRLRLKTIEKETGLSLEFIAEETYELKLDKKELYDFLYTISGIYDIELV